MLFSVKRFFSTKIILNLCFVLLFVNNSLTQSELWPTSQADWYYTYSDGSTFYGYARSSIDRDTTIQGKNCQIYSQLIQTKNTGLPSPNLITTTNSKQFVLHLEDSLLSIYNEQTSEFDTVMNFKAQVGDSWQTHLYDTVCFPDSYPEIHTKVISKELVSMNGQNFLRFQLNRVGADDYIHSSDYFYQTLGDLQGLFVFNKLCSQTDFSKEVHLRCFASSEMGNAFNYTDFPLACDATSTLNLDEKHNSQSTIKVVNPSKFTEIEFVGVDPSMVQAIHLVEVGGRNVEFTASLSSNSLILYPKKPLVSGVYFYTIEFVQGNRVSGKVLVQD